MMDIKQLKVTVGEVCEGYFNDAEEGVVGYDDRLDIRPKYQREFVYKDNQRDEVIRAVLKGLPLNVIYWCKVKKGFLEGVDSDIMHWLRPLELDYVTWLPADRQIVDQIQATFAA